MLRRIHHALLRLVTEHPLMLPALFFAYLAAFLLFVFAVVYGGAAIRSLAGREVPFVSRGLIVGLIWGAWHIMANDIWAIKTYSGEIPTVLYAVLSGLSFLIGQLPPFRVLMVWAYERTGSLLLMMVMHASLTACSIAFAPTAMAGWQVFIYSLAVAALFWLVAAAVVAANRQQFLLKGGIK